MSEIITKPKLVMQWLIHNARIITDGDEYDYLNKSYFYIAEDDSPRLSKHGGEITIQQDGGIISNINLGVIAGFTRIGENIRIPVNFIRSKQFTIDATSYKQLLENLQEPTSLEGSPKHVEGDFNVFVPTDFSLEGIPEYSKGHMWMIAWKGNSLAGIGKKCQHIGKTLAIGGNVTSSILGCLLIDGLKNVKTTSLGTLSNEERGKMMLAFNTLNSHLSADRDLVSCKRELISHGLKEYAKL